MNYTAVDLPRTLNGLFASIATDAGSIATVICGFSTQFRNTAPLTIIDWSRDDLSPKTLARIVPAAAAALESLREEIRVNAPPPDVILIDTGGAGGPLCAQAQAAGYAAEAITEEGPLKYPILSERVLAASFYLTSGAVTAAKTALEYDMLHRGVFGNHLVRDLKAFDARAKDTRDPGALLVAVANGVLEAFTDETLMARALENA
jgi:hypothetical protein